MFLMVQPLSTGSYRLVVLTGSVDVKILGRDRLEEGQIISRFKWNIALQFKR